MRPASRALVASVPGAAAMVGHVVLTGANQGDIGFASVTTLSILPYLVSGCLIAWQRPSNPIGWLMLGLPTFFAVAVAAGQYSELAAARALPGDAAATWVSYWAWVPGWLALGVVFLVFPDGRLPARYGRSTAVLITAASALATGLAMVSNDTRTTQTGRPNPLAVEVPVSLYELVIPLMLVVFAAPAVSLIARYRFGTERARKQLKWLAVGAAALVSLSLAYLVAGLREPSGAPTPADLIFMAGIAAPAVAIVIAILRDRVFDIDVLIRRTLVYGGLSVVLGATYLVFVAAVQAVLRPLTSGSEIAVAGSTLITVALAQPFRRSIQRIVDRRFYRSRYDAARTLDRFASRMRDQVELEAVRGDVLDVIRETLQPAHANIWLREIRIGSGGK